ncbi:MAG: hypothetical protein J7639_08505, partial [Paenibacillaceae bacterium]|nr:hypothetical protein [Paenibacillaceae bacterium]
EKRNELGPGAFGEYNVTTSSSGASLLKEIEYKGPFEQLNRHPQVRTVAQCEKPVQAEMLALALKEIGHVIYDTLGGASNVFLHSSVRRIDMDSASSSVTILLDDNKRIRANHVLLATGRCERAHPELEAWRDKVWLSSTIIRSASRSALKEELVRIQACPIVIAGCSHSAMSALSLLLAATDELAMDCKGYKRPPITILQRSPARLMYNNVAEAGSGQVPGREQIFNRSRDVCPVTGIVFRDSGLRHGSKELYIKLFNGQVDNTRIVQASKLEDAAVLLDAAGLIVQALGYHGVAPDIFMAGKLFRSADSDERLHADPSGAAVVGGENFANLSVLRAEPTPKEYRDHSVYGSGLYKRLALRLEQRITGARVNGDARR